MTDIMQALTAGGALFFWLPAGVLALMVAYLLLLTGAACLAPRRPHASSAWPTWRFAVVVPAHNEEQLLPRLLTSLAALDYSPSLYTVHVIADNCTDGTAALAHKHGAHVHERNNRQKMGKGHALQWLLMRLDEDEQNAEAILIVDADSYVAPNFLKVMDAKLSQGARAVQAYYGVLDEESAWTAALRSASLAALHYVRPQGRAVLGASVGLKGNGMVLRRELVAAHPWSAAVTEDIDYHMTLLLAGERVHFAPKAVVLASMPASLRSARTQNIRWEQGRIEMIRRYVPRLCAYMGRSLRRGHWGQAYISFDALMEHLIPPFSLLMLLSIGLVGAALRQGTAPALAVAAWVLLGQTIYLLAALVMTRAAGKVYLALLYAPLFLLWKATLYLLVLVGVERQGWVRTAREESP